MFFLTILCKNQCKVIFQNIKTNIYFDLQPFKPQFSDLDYADVDYRSYGPINYKKASIEAAEERKSHVKGDFGKKPQQHSPLL